MRGKEFPCPAERRITRLRRKRTGFGYVDAERGTSLESREIELEPAERVDHSAEVQRQPRTCPKSAVPEQAPVPREIASEIGHGRPGGALRNTPPVLPVSHVARRQSATDRPRGRASRHDYGLAVGLALAPGRPPNPPGLPVCEPKSWPSTFVPPTTMAVADTIPVVSAVPTTVT